jgi:lysophospholipid acyltransferase (LPLAT)-like uncharacterized protein
MRLNLPFIPHTIGLLASAALRWLRSTIDWKAVYFDPLVDPVHPHFHGRFVYAGWHEYMMMPIILRGHRDMLALASEHGDGELISQAMRHLSWTVARGSSSRGGTAALLRMLRDDRRHPNLTPDGPRGPRREFSQGALFLASKLGLPLVCVGYGYDRPWRTRSWDQFAVPRPYSRCRAVFGPPLKVPGRLDREALAGYSRWFGRLLDWLTTEAETWAADGRRRSGEMPLIVREAPPGMRRWTPEWSPRMPADLAAEWPALSPARPGRAA